MTAVVAVFLLFVSLVAAVVKTDKSPSNQDQELLQPAESNHGLVGVASVAGIASRNGRYSTLGGIQIYPGLDAPITITNNDGSYFYPLTVTKESDGKYASGSIQVIPGYPGSVVVSSTAHSGYGPNIKTLNTNTGFESKINPLSLNKPILKEFFFQPMPDLFEKSRNLDPIEPWFLKNLFPFNPRVEGTDNGWFYPNFNPFMNFWR